jgi:hypothetical protein
MVRRAELERVGLLAAPPDPAADLAAPATPFPGLSGVLERLEALAAENGRLRLLEAEAGAEREARERLEGKLHELRSWGDQVRTASWRRRRQLLREAPRP